MSLFIKKPLDLLIAEAADTEKGLKKTLRPCSLVLLGIGAIIGAGLFSITGVAAATMPDRPSPSHLLSPHWVCAFAGLCYAEFASMIPVAGSAYTYSYATMGEFIAWVIGWDLVLEYAVGAATVAISWSRYLVKFLEGFDVHLPPESNSRALGWRDHQPSRRLYCCAAEPPADQRNKRKRQGECCDRSM